MWLNAGNKCFQRDGEEEVGVLDEDGSIVRTASPPPPWVMGGGGGAEPFFRAGIRSNWDFGWELAL